MLLGYAALDAMRFLKESCRLREVLEML